MIEFIKEMSEYSSDIAIDIVKSPTKEKAVDFTKKKYGENVEIINFFVKEKSKYASILELGKVCFEKSETIGKMINAKPQARGQPMKTLDGYYYTDTKNTRIGGDIILRLIKEKLRLPNEAKAVFIDRTEEGEYFGEIERESGAVITSNGYYVYYWLEFDEKKGFYLDPCEILKIIEL